MRALSSLSDGPDASPEGWLWSVLPEAEEVAITSAYLTRAGLDLITAPLQAALLAGARALIVSGGRADQIDAQALRALLQLERSFPGQVETILVPAGATMLTAKSYAVASRDGSLQAWLGSANLTRAGLTRNLQTGVVFHAANNTDTDYPAALKILTDARRWRDAPEGRRLDEDTFLALAARHTGGAMFLGDAVEDLIDHVEWMSYNARTYGHDTPAPTTSSPANAEDAEVTNGQPASTSSPETPSEDAPPEDDVRTVRSQPRRPVLTGFVDLDILLGGLHPGCLYLIGGESGVGKSVLALNFARTAATSAIPTSFFSFQDSATTLMRKLFAAEARVLSRNLARGTMSDADWTRFARTLGAIGDMPLLISHAGRLNVQQLREEVYAASNRLGQPIELIVIDSVASLLPDPHRPATSREQEVSQVAVALKAMAVELQAVIVVTTGLTRGPQQRSDKRPILADVRDSGQLIESADAVILLHREDMYERESPRAGEADLIVAKSRNSPTDTITLAFQGHYARFMDMTS